MARGEPIEAPAASADFGELLRQHRLAAGLTQESLAQAAGLSVHGIQKLERGVSHPYRDTAQRLIAALQLTGTDEARLRTAARPVPRRDRAQLVAPAGVTDSTSNNLPIPITTFIARAGEITRVTEVVRKSRLLTITGSGGCGKTRLALEVARGLVGSFTDGVWLVDLAPLTDAALVSQTIATVVGIRDVPGRPLLDALTDHLRGRHMLLILDNCEHVIDACANVADRLLQSCAQLHVLATSRELLGIDGEATWRVTSLSVVDPRRLANAGAQSITELLDSEAVQLFVDRARLVVPSFAITEHNTRAVAQVCQRLDGIPLALELAAARLAMLSAEQIAARLDQRFRLLTGGNRTAVRRQQTLEATIDWSYQLLSEDERNLLRRLAVFAGGWSLEAAEALGSDLVRPQTDVLDLLSRLVDKSMVLVDDPAESEPSIMRYRFLETIRQYAEQKLAESGEAEVVRTRHRDWYLSLAEQAIDGMEGADQKRWWARLELERDNLRLALGWSAADPSGSEELLRLAGSLGRFWMVRGFAREGIGWLEVALASTEATHSAARARVLNWLGELEMDHGNVRRAMPLLEESIVQARTVGDRRLLSLALRHLGTALAFIGDHAGARGSFEEALAVSRETGVKREIAWNLLSFAANQMNLDHTANLELLLLESIAAGRDCGDLAPVISAIWTLSRLYWVQGDVARARRMLNEALTLARDIDMKSLLPGLLVTLGDLALADQDWRTAADWYRQGLGTANLLATPGTMAHALRHCAALRCASGDYRGAVRILGAASSVHDTAGVALVTGPAAEKDLLAAARRTLGENEYAGAWVEGLSLTLEDAIADALGEQTENNQQ
jgi:predicted ATPase/transcriptional regulator with XRE-family HTH domain